MTPSEYLGAPDVFICYARSDGATYANRLAARLTAASLYCVIDQWHSEPHRRVPPSLLRLVRRSRLLVIVGSKGGAKSIPIRQEIDAFLPTKRTIVPIDADGTIRTAAWWEAIDGLLPTPDHGALPEVPNQPAESVVEIILAAVDFTTRDQRLKHAARVSKRVLAGALAVAVLAMVGTVWRVNEADQKTSLAELNRSVAENARTSAVAEERSARFRREDAEGLRQLAVEVTSSALSELATAEDKAEVAEERAADARQIEARSRLIAQARTALNARVPQEAFEFARRALSIQDGDDARLILSEVWNTGLAVEHLAIGRRAHTIEVNPANPSQISAITVADTDTENQLEIHERGRTDPIVTRDYDFQAVKYDAAGRSIYAIGLNERQRPQTRYRVGDEDTYRAWLVHYDLNLTPLATVELGPFPGKPGRLESRLISVGAMRVDATRLVLVGSAREGLKTQHPIVAWIDLATMRPQYSVDAEGWGNYSGQLAAIGTGGLVLDSPAGLFLLDLRSGQRQEIRRLYPERLRLVGDRRAERFITCNLRNNQIVSYSRGPSGRWRDQTYKLDDSAPCRMAEFVRGTQVAVARRDGSIWILDVDPYFADTRFVGTQSNVWRVPVARRLGAHNGTVTGLAVSPDGRWIATAGADNAVRLWSVFGETDRQFTMRAAVEHLRWSAGSDSLYAADISGRVWTLRPEVFGRFTRRLNPESTRAEMALPQLLHEWRRQYLHLHFGFISALSSSPAGDLTAFGIDGIRTTWDSRYHLRSSSLLTPPPTRVDTRSDSRSGSSSPERQWQVTINESERAFDIHDRASSRRRLRLVTDSRHALVLKAPRNVRERRQTLAFALNSDGDGIAVVDVERERVRVHRIANVDSLAFEVAEDGTLVVAADNGQLYWSTWETGTLAELGVHGNVKPALALSSDGRWMATSLQANGSVRLWNRSGEYFEYRLQNQVVALLFSLSGRELLAASGASVHSWAVPSDEFLRTAIGQVPQSRPTIPTAALRGYLGTPGFRALRYREATQSWEELPTQHVDDKIAPSVQPMVLASVLASDLESADRRIAAAGRLARLKTADPRVVDTALSGLRAVKHYPAIAQATLGYLSSTAGAAGPVLLSRLETEREGNLLAGLLWGARELQLQSPALLTGARRGLQSSDPDLQLLSATIAGGTESSPEILRALLSWRQSPLVKNDDVWPLVLAYDTKVAVRVIARLGEIDQRDAITFIGQAGPVAVPWLTRLAEERLRTDTHLVILATLKRLSPDVVLPPTALQSNDSNPVYVSSEDFFKKEVEALRKGAGASPCHDFFVPVPAPDDPSDLALFKEAARLLLARTGRLDTEDSVACLWKLRDMGRASGIEPIEFVPLLNRTSQRIDPMRYRINDAILLDLEDAEVPLDVVKALRAAQPIEWDPRETFEKRMTEVLGEQSWQRHRTQILATAGRAVPSFCDEDGPLSLVTSILENYGPAAARAEVPLRALAAKYANCTDVVGDIARALNFIIPP